MNKNIVLINRGNGSNLGDSAIKISFEKLLKSLGNNVEFNDLIEARPKNSFVNKNQPKLKRDLMFLKKLLPKRIGWYLKNREMFKRVFFEGKIDYVIIGGGQLINDNKLFPIATYLWIKKFKKIKDIKISLFAIGAMDRFSFINKWFYKVALRSVDFVYVRDNFSKRALKEVFNRDSFVTHDVVFSLEIKEVIRDRIDTRKKYLIGITPYHRYKKYNNKLTKQEYLESWVKCIKELSLEYEVQLFYTTLEDYNYSVVIKTLLKDHGIDVNIAEIVDLESLLKVIANGDIIQSQRMHALILAKMLGKEIKPIILSDKIQSFVEQYLEVNFNKEIITKNILSNLKEMLED